MSPSRDPAERKRATKPRVSIVENNDCFNCGLQPLGNVSARVLRLGSDAEEVSLRKLHSSVRAFQPRSIRGRRSSAPEKSLCDFQTAVRII
jgi:hypothetical protein